MEKDHWKNMQDVNTHCCNISNIRRLPANLKTAKPFPAITIQIYRYKGIPNTIPACFAIQKLNDQLISLLTLKETTHRKFFLLTSNEYATASEEYHWQMGTRNRGGAQSITTTSLTKTEVSLRECFTTDLSHHSSFANGVKETQMTALCAQEPAEP
jgi:hypothetical protein